jgi:Flp pilus assembly protein TadD
VRRLSPITLSLLITAALPPAAAAQSTPRDAVALVEAGNTALDAGRFGDALDAFTKASSILPRDARLRLGAGFAGFMLGRDEDARTFLEAALVLNARFVEASEWLGELHYRSGLERRDRDR